MGRNRNRPVEPSPGIPAVPSSESELCQLSLMMNAVCPAGRYAPGRLGRILTKMFRVGNTDLCPF